MDTATDRAATLPETPNIELKNGTGTSWSPEVAGNIGRSLGTSPIFQRPALGSQWPWWTCGMTAAAVLLTLLPGVAPLCEYLPLADQPWRIVTGHFVHWSANHLLWDALMFAVLGAVVEQRDRAAFLLTVFGSCLAISATLWCLGMESYRGLSGVDSALFSLACGQVWRAAGANREFLPRFLVLLLATGFCGKVSFEILTGRTLFVSSEGSFLPLPMVHAVGAAVGIVVDQWRNRCAADAPTLAEDS